jgi:hypothetical protein
VVSWVIPLLERRLLWVAGFYLQIARKKRADERTRTAFLLITRALLTPEGAADDASLLMLSTIFLCGDLSLLDQHETLAEDRW